MKIEMLSVRDLVPNAANPNQMDEREFNALCESLQEEGWTNPLQVVDRGNGTYSVVAGHHRLDAATALGYEEAPCVLLDPEKFDDDRQKWVMVKDNIITGKLNPEKFVRLYDEMSKRYDTDVLQSLMGFTTEDAFRRVYGNVKKALPPELQDALEGMKDEIKTIDDLSLVLNRLFKDHGETLDSDFMVFSWGGKDVFWVRVSEKMIKNMKAWGETIEGSLGHALERLVEDRQVVNEETPPEDTKPA